MNSENNSKKTIKALSLGLTPANTDIEFQIVDFNAGLTENYNKYSS